MLPMFPWQAYSTIGWLTDTLPLRFIGMPLNEKGCLNYIAVIHFTCSALSPVGMNPYVAT